jgi:hypothetical protein
MRIEYKNDPCPLLLDYIEVVEREWRAMPILSKSGKPVVTQTMFNPSDWDEYGKLRTWARVQRFITGKGIGFWRDHVPPNVLVLSTAILVAIGIMVSRRWHQGKKPQKRVVEEDALLSTDSESASGFYTEIPIVRMDKWNQDDGCSMHISKGRATLL